MNGFLNVLKPPGMSSAAVVGLVKRLTGAKRVGHAGTLDPEAAGVLPIMVGRAARLFDYLVDKRKTYVAEVAFGTATDTQDATGTVIETGERFPGVEQVRLAARELTGDIWQRPSAFSAIKQDGKPLYERVRSGECVEAPLRQVHVEEIRVLRELPEHGMLLSVDCGKGTYIRSICNDLGVKVGCPAHMRFLLRTCTGAFELDNAYTLEELEAKQKEGTLQACLLPLDMPIQHYPRVDAPHGLGKLVQNGAKLPVNRLVGAAELAEGQVARVYLDDAFWGMAAREAGQLVWRAQMPPSAD